MAPGRNRRRGMSPPSREGARRISHRLGVRTVHVHGRQVERRVSWLCLHRAASAPVPAPNATTPQRGRGTRPFADLEALCEALPDSDRLAAFEAARHTGRPSWVDCQARRREVAGPARWSLNLPEGPKP